MLETLFTIEPESHSDQEPQLSDDDFFLPGKDVVSLDSDLTFERSDSASEVAGQFSEEMEKQGIHAKVLEGEDNPFPDILRSLTLVDHDQLPNEPTVRLYRGINPKNGYQIAHQVGYLLKRPIYDESKPGDQPDVELESPEVFSLVDAFADNPSYRSLMDTVDATQMADNDRQFVDGRVKALRRDFLKYPESTFLEELSREHTRAPGGAPSQDLSPFVATSTRPEYATGWGRTLMVIDVPISRIAGLGEGKDSGDEVLLTGEIKPEWITAVAELKQGERPTADTLIPFVEALRQHELIVASDLADTELHKKSEQNRQDDLQEINHDLIGEILSIPNLDIQNLSEIYATHAIETYKEALWVAAEYYVKQIQSTGRWQHVQDIHELYQYDDVTQINVSVQDFHEQFQYDDAIQEKVNDPETVQIDVDDEPDLLIDNSEPEAEQNELTIKELEKMVKIYNNLSQVSR